MCGEKKEKRRDSLKCYIHLSFPVTFYDESVICGSADYRAYESFQRSEIPSNLSGFHYRIYHSARLARLPSNTKAKSRALHLCCKWKLVPPPSSESSNFNLAPKSMRSPLPRRPDRTRYIDLPRERQVYYSNACTSAPA